jgi:sec-independent protein translocase protein TatB
MFDIGWQELFIVAVIGVIIIGPKDLPRALRTVAKWVRKARALAREFQGGLDDMVREAELDDLKKNMESTANLDITKEIENTIDPTGDIGGDLDMHDLEEDLDAAGRAEAPPPAVEHVEPEDDGPVDADEAAAGSDTTDDKPLAETPAKASG